MIFLRSNYLHSIKEKYSSFLEFKVSIGETFLSNRSSLLRIFLKRNHFLSHRVTTLKGFVRFATEVSSIFHDIPREYRFKNPVISR